MAQYVVRLHFASKRGSIEPVDRMTLLVVGALLVLFVLGCSLGLIGYRKKLKRRDVARNNDAGRSCCRHCCASVLYNAVRVRCWMHIAPQS